MSRNEISGEPTEIAEAQGNSAQAVSPFGGGGGGGGWLGARRDEDAHRQSTQVQRIRTQAIATRGGHAEESRNWRRGQRRDDGDYHRG